MEDVHIMTPEEINALFKDEIKEAGKTIPDIRVTFIKVEKR